MFDIGFTELLLVAIIALVVLGPERLPHAVRTTGKWVGKIRSMFNQVKEQIESELDADEIRQQIHNDSIMQQLEQSKQDLKGNLDEVRASLKSAEFDLHSSTESQPSATDDNHEESKADQATARSSRLPAQTLLTPTSSDNSDEP
ncbi:sec-independent protein translocase protein TatB [Sinobacterium caligoides]|uniref:Sec-independent protein translocase protein TatB n=1 Tax=Sinobacterium caligoides TaxID=933926 RepID=A0A3N2DDT9_9GAMM|nr:Sec-independent protein translocase protein TatB [Sinobacterium caligoides]ROR97943.1 sec-independent protein translocase protein TatB [Sinobacterium caligoides]